MPDQLPFPQGAAGVTAVVDSLAQRLPETLQPLARVAFNYRWSWVPGGAAPFQAVDADRFARRGDNPVQLLIEASPAQLQRAAADPDVVSHAAALARDLDAELARPFASAPADRDAPVAFFCAEFGIHPSLPIYSGGLGVLAGDILKEASDLALPMVGVGLLYGHGYFHQRLDHSGWQHEFWTEIDPHLAPLSPVLGSDGEPLRVRVPIGEREVWLRMWRADVGRVPLFLLDADVPENAPVDRWITSRLYDGNRDVRLAQYAVLGIGGVRALAALGIEPGTLHLNEGHAALATLELAARDVEAGVPRDEALRRAADRVAFTTHTPVAAGNETYPPEQLLGVVGDLADRLGGRDTFLALARTDPDDRHAEAGMTPVALRLSRSVNGVSEIHGRVAREMWQGLFHVPEDEVPITHVTNGVHVPTWTSGPLRRLLDQYLGENWISRAAEPGTWEAVDDIPDEQLWAARVESRSRLIEDVRERSVLHRLARGDHLDVVEAAARSLDPRTLTVGFARRVATYKRLHLLRHDPNRLIKLLDDPQPLQLLFAGKAHPADDGAKAVLRSLLDLRDAPQMAERVAFLEDYDLSVGQILTAGCDVWLNVPRPPLEASGTSGMKSALNGGVNLSVLDGWWAEAFDGDNGWGIEPGVETDEGQQDAQHAQQLYDLLEHHVLPLFHEQDERGVPVAWVRMVKASLKTVGPHFAATRMLGDYVSDVYRRGA